MDQKRSWTAFQTLLAIAFLGWAKIISDLTCSLITVQTSPTHTNPAAAPPKTTCWTYVCILFLPIAAPFSVNPRHSFSFAEKSQIARSWRHPVAQRARKERLHQDNGPRIGRTAPPATTSGGRTRKMRERKGQRSGWWWLFGGWVFEVSVGGGSRGRMDFWERVEWSNRCFQGFGSIPSGKRVVCRRFGADFSFTVKAESTLT